MKHLLKPKEEQVNAASIECGIDLKSREKKRKSLDSRL